MVVAAWGWPHCNAIRMQRGANTAAFSCFIHSKALCHGMVPATFKVGLPSSSMETPSQAQRQAWESIVPAPVKFTMKTHYHRIQRCELKTRTKPKELLGFAICQRTCSLGFPSHFSMWLLILSQAFWPSSELTLSSAYLWLIQIQPFPCLIGPCCHQSHCFKPLSFHLLQRPQRPKPWKLEGSGSENNPISESRTSTFRVMAGLYELSNPTPTLASSQNN